MFLNGGPSHLDMWDMKPDLPKEMRSEFQPVATSVPGIQVCEHLPRLCAADVRCTLVRSVHHDQVAHAPAVYTALTGIPSSVRAGILGAKPPTTPPIGSVVGRFRPPASQVMPYVLMPYLTAEGAGGPPQPGFLGGWLGKTHDPFLVLKGGKDPDGFNLPALTPEAGMTAERVRDRSQLLAGVNRAGGRRAAGQAEELERLQARACDLLTSSAAQRAFRLDQEPAQVRDAYGRNIYGQSLLLARRLVEAGTRLACISWAPDANATWDTHGSNFAKLKNELLPPFDLGFSALLTDLTDRGLLERTLVVVMGEIGRTPKINGGAGRDHWEFCYTVLFAGGGVKGGFVYGASDKHGAVPEPEPGHRQRHRRHHLPRAGDRPGPGTPRPARPAACCSPGGRADSGRIYMTNWGGAGCRFFRQSVVFGTAHVALENGLQTCAVLKSLLAEPCARTRS